MPGINKAQNWTKSGFNQDGTRTNKRHKQGLNMDLTRTKDGLNRF